jgi:hypothetical protein
MLDDILLGTLTNYRVISALITGQKSVFQSLISTLPKEIYGMAEVLLSLRTPRKIDSGSMRDIKCNSSVGTVTAQLFNKYGIIILNITGLNNFIKGSAAIFTVGHIKYTPLSMRRLVSISSAVGHKMVSRKVFLREKNPPTFPPHLQPDNIKYNASEATTKTSCSTTAKKPTMTGK